MNFLDPFKKSFLATSLLLFALLALITQRQVLVGKVPLPAELLGYFSPWRSVHINTGIHHAEMGDSVTLFFPWRHFLATSLRQWNIPLWNPMILGGTPFLGETQSALFYPLRLLYLVFSIPTAWTVEVLLNVMFAGLFTSWFVRDFGASRTGAIASGIIFGCCGFLTGWQLFSPLAEVAVWLPFTFFSVQRLCQRPSFERMVLAAAGFTLAVLAGHPETSFLVVSAATAFALWECVVTGRADATVGRRFLWFAGAGVLALGLAALQLIPSLEWLRHQSLTADIRWPARPLIELLAFISRDVTQTPNSLGFIIPECAAYVGPLTLLLAPMALFFKKKWSILFFILLIFVSLQMVLQKGPVNWIIEQIPTLARMKNWRALLLEDFALATLAGVGITVLSDPVNEKETLAKYKWLLFIPGSIGIGWGVWLLFRLTISPVKWYRGPGSTAVIFTAAVLLISARFLKLLKGRAFTTAILLLLIADLCTFRSGTLPFVRPSMIEPDVPLFRFLASKDPSQYRIGVVDGTIASNVSMLYGVSEAGGYDVELKLAQNYMDDFRYPEMISIDLSAEQIVRHKDRRLDLLNVRYIVATTENASASILSSQPDRFTLVYSEGPLRVFENRGALDRVRFLPAAADTIEVVRDMDSQLARMKDPTFDVENRVLLEDVPAGWKPVTDSSTSPSSSASSHVDWISTSPDELVVRLTDPQPGIIEVGQIYYPGWRAYVDGREVPVLRADYGLVAIPVVTDGHVVRFVYDPLSFRIGLSITFLAVLMSLTVLAYRAYRKYSVTA